ncbi:hypothetical protein KKE60_08595, partial [Patescibacteria group bacterium]|nr:hypothetical protein [Patescibacteria group bacterium]
VEWVHTKALLMWIFAQMRQDGMDNDFEKVKNWVIFGVVMFVIIVLFLIGFSDDLKQKMYDIQWREELRKNEQ